MRSAIQAYRKAVEMSILGDTSPLLHPRPRTTQGVRGREGRAGVEGAALFARRFSVPAAVGRGPG